MAVCIAFIFIPGFWLVVVADALEVVADAGGVIGVVIVIIIVIGWLGGITVIVKVLLKIPL